MGRDDPGLQPPDALARQCGRLFAGLVDQQIRAGKEFLYDGGKLHADEVADLMLPSVLCLAQDLSDRLGMGAFGYRFTLRSRVAEGFPLAMERAADDCNGVASEKRFLEIAPFVLEVFEGEVMDAHLNLARLFESAARLVVPDFRLDRDSNFCELGSGA